MTALPDDMPAWLAKDALDVGLFTNQLEPMLDFWSNTIGLVFDHMLPLFRGVRQHRHTHANAVFKLNHSRHALPARAEGGYQRLIIAKPEIKEAQDLTDPDGNLVSLVPTGTDGVEHWAIEVATASKIDFRRFYAEQLGLPVSDTHDCAVFCGKSLIIGRKSAHAERPLQDMTMARLGYRYITLQVRAVDTVHNRVVAAGGTEAKAPETLGETARISFIKDAAGNWIELSQRKSITGSLTSS